MVKRSGRRVAKKKTSKKDVRGNKVFDQVADDDSIVLDADTEKMVIDYRNARRDKSKAGTKFKSKKTALIEHMRDNEIPRVPVEEVNGNMKFPELDADYKLKEVTEKRGKANTEPETSDA